MRQKTAFLTLIAVVAVAGGCASGDSEASARGDDTSGTRDSIAAVAAASMNESQVLALLRETNAADSALGALGAARGSTLVIKDFGRMIMREHHALNVDGAGVGRDAGIPAEALRIAPDEAPASARAILDSAAAGAAWDNSYIEYAVLVHQAALENTARALAATKRPEVKSFIEKSVPILQKHLDKARSLQKAAQRVVPKS
jgi:putative membrane protein